MFVEKRMNEPSVLDSSPIPHIHQVTKPFSISSQIPLLVSPPLPHLLCPGPLSLLVWMIFTAF